ncbi:probable leucine-rich repeat receptor-like protein kinase At5g63930 [Magnolia sinica]|uniref:probable leucine-rich repeat receptor-like protein kinase At5g63930 n=1 Tax=Magnolia sinica TaxID=86752 RepID=UPI0026587838|nr:probable leucine-rich repeat receptor-like protein kinase At5g63930 [Magnolia sinica]
MSLLSLLSFLFTTLVYLQTVCGNAELKSLLEVKAALDPVNRFLSSWAEDGDPCSGTFEGVACNEHGRVANISLQGKGLYGSVSAAISGLKSLTGLYLHYNSLYGEIPREISHLTELSDLYLNVNNLSGSIPVEIGNMDNLQVLQLCYNQLSGNIPTQLGFLKKLSVLALQCNRLTGAIPASLGDLSMLMRVDLSFNRLFGSIPGKLADVPQLEVLDVRNNTLSGNVPPALKRLNDGFQFGNNSELCGVGFSTLRACAYVANPNRPEPGSAGDIPQSANINMNCRKGHCQSTSKTPAIAVVIGVIAVVVGGTATGLFAFSWYRRRKQRISSAFDVSDSRISTDQAKDFYRKSASPLISLEYSNGWDPLADGRSGVGFPHEVLQEYRFNLEEVESATQYFSEVNLLGKSNFAATYRGILRDGSAVAVKSINKTSCKSEDAEFLKGLKILTSLRHDNIVGLRGFCCSRGRGECFLIYDFVVNGNLSQYFDVKGDNGRVLDWSTRVSIVNGIAKGIEYLHSNKTSKPALVHQNISAEKILIDQYFNPLLSDSGLHKLLVDDVVFSTLKASAAMGYLAPEYTTTGRFTEKSDVYAFGVIVLQILSGKRRITHLTRVTAESGKLEDLIDGNLHGKFSNSEAVKLRKVALVCTNDAPDRRPTMGMVIEELSKCSSL